MPNIDKECTTHHVACECREEKMAAVIEAAKALIDSREYKGYIIDLDFAIRDFEGRK